MVSYVEGTLLSGDGDHNHTFIRVVVVKLGLPFSRRSKLCRLLVQHFLHAFKCLIEKAATNIRRSGSLGYEQALVIRRDPIEMNVYNPILCEARGDVPRRRRDRGIASGAGSFDMGRTA